MKYNYIQKLLSYYYRRFARLIAKNPMYFVIIPFVFSAILSMGIIAVKIERNADYLYTIRDGVATKNKLNIEKQFPMNLSSDFDLLRLTDRSNFLYVMIFPHDGGNVLTNKYLEEIASIDNYARNLKVEWNNTIFTYDTICAKNKGDCYNNPILLYKPEQAYNKEKNQMKYPIAIDPLTYVFVPYLANIGGVVTDSDGNVEIAKAARLVYVLDHSNSNIKPVVVKWQNAFMKHMSDWRSELVTIQSYVPTAIGEEFSEFTTELIPFVGIAAMVITVFSMLTSNTNDWVRSKPWLGMAACFSAAFAIGASFGTLMICGVFYVDINIALPFLILGMGVDDAYVLIAAWRRTKSEWSVEKRMEETYSEAAVSISITSLTNFLSFCVGIMMPFPVMNIFCLYAATAVVFTFVYLILFFGACLALSGYREKSGIHAFTCQVLVISANNPSPELENADDIIMAFFRDKLGTLLTYIIFRVVVIAAYVAILAGGIWGLQFLSGSVEIADVFSYNSPLTKAVKSHYKYFTEYPYTIQVVINETLNYADPNIQVELNELFVRLESSPLIADESARLSWLKYYLSFQNNPFGKLLLRGYNTSDKQEFIDGLQDVFLNIRLAEQFKLDIVFNDNYTEIISSRFVFLAKDVNTVADEQKIYKYIQRFAETSRFSMVTHSMLFTVFEQTSEMPSVIIQLGWVTTLLIAILFFLFIPNVRCAICVSLTVISSLLETIGYMAIWGVKLDIFSMIILTLGAGFSINYPTHISFSFMIDKSSRAYDRLKNCLFAVGLPICQGTLSTILALLPLLYKRAYMLDACFKIVFLIALLTAFHSLFVIPVVLSLLGTSLRQNPSSDNKMIEEADLEEQEECLEKKKRSSKEIKLKDLNSDVYFLKKLSFHFKK